MKRLVAVLLVSALVAAGCGLPSDNEPRTLDLSEIPEALWPGQLPTPTPEAGPASRNLSDKQIHMLGPGNRLRLVERETGETAEDLLRILLSGTSLEEVDEGITSAISARNTGISIVAVDEVFQVVTVDLAPGSLDPSNSEQKLAFAQIVFTLTSLPGIELVEFVQFDPENPGDAPADLAVQTDTGTTLPGTLVGRADFEELDPDTGPVPAVPAFDIPVPTPTVDSLDRTPVTIWKVRQVFLDDTGIEVVGEVANLEASEARVESRLVAVVRQVEDPATPKAIVANVLSGTPAGERRLGLRSALPPDAFVNSVVVTPFDVVEVGGDGVVNIAQVDLAIGSLPNDDDGNERLLAAAQLVFVLTGLDEIDSVVFSIDGELQPMPTDNGRSDVFDPSNPVGLTRVDYALEAPGGYLWRPQPTPAVAPTPTPEPTATPTPDS